MVAVTIGKGVPAKSLERAKRAAAGKEQNNGKWLFGHFITTKLVIYHFKGLPSLQ